MADEKNTAVEAKAEAAGKKGISEEKLEIIIAILLGVTAILTAWAGWVGSLHGGNQATNYPQSNNLSAMYNEAAQSYMQDMLLWNQISDYMFDIEIANANGRTAEAALIEEKVQTLIYDNCTEEFAAAIEWSTEQEEYATPFEKEGYVDSYFAEANEVLAEADALLEEGKQDNANGDAYGLVTVIYSLVLFLLGIVGIFKKIPNRVLILVFACVCLVIATVYMITIPMPTGFNLASFFVH